MSPLDTVPIGGTGGSGETSVQCRVSRGEGQCGQHATTPLTLLV